MGNNQRLPESCFQKGAQDESEDKRSPVVLEFLHEIAEDPEDEHHDHIDDPQVHAVRADQAEQD
jgi:hypothetical protein